VGEAEVDIGEGEHTLGDRIGKGTLSSLGWRLVIIKRKVMGQEVWSLDSRCNVLT
jgi:hypothetical protein